MLRGILAVVAIMLSVQALASFKITYSEDAPAKKRLKDSVLLLNNATDFLVEVGSGVAAGVPGDAKRVPIGDAFMLLTPPGWRAYNNGVELDEMTVDLVSGEPWTRALERAGKDHDMIFTVDWGRKEIHVEPHVEKGRFDVSANPVGDDEAMFDVPKRLHLKEGDLREALELFTMLNQMKLEVDVFTEDRELRVHPTIVEYTHPIPSCVTWSLPNRYQTITSEWLSELNRILKPYRLKTFLFANDVVFLTSLHNYGSDFCGGKTNEL